VAVFASKLICHRKRLPRTLNLQAALGKGKVQLPEQPLKAVQDPVVNFRGGCKQVQFGALPVFIHQLLNAAFAVQANQQGIVIPADSPGCPFFGNPFPFRGGRQIIFSTSSLISSCPSSFHPLTSITNNPTSGHNTQKSNSCPCISLL